MRRCSPCALAALLTLVALTSCDQNAKRGPTAPQPAEADLIAELSAIGYVEGTEAAGTNAGVSITSKPSGTGDRGRALEVTPSQQVVWEFHDPFRVGEKRDRVAGLYALERVPRPNWLAGTRPRVRK